MALPRLFRWIIDRLESDSIPYGMGGWLGGLQYGRFRATNDIDIVIAPTLAQLAALVRAAELANFYASDVAAAEAMKNCGSFNVIDPDTGFKADLYVVTLDSRSIAQLDRVILSTLDDELPASFCSVEDVILKKLEFFAEGSSRKHIEDIAHILALKNVEIDRTFVAAEVQRLGLIEQWEEVLACAKILANE